MMTKVFLALGSNTGSRKALIEEACRHIGEGVGTIVSYSRVYVTEPSGYASPHLYLNACISILTDAKPLALLAECLGIEQQMGRERKEGQLSDRKIDIDVLLFGDLCLESGNLIIPHPRMHMRRFVLAPLAEIAAEVIHPILEKNIGSLLVDCEDPLSVQVYKEDSFLTI